MDPLDLTLGFAAFACIADDIEEEAQKQGREEELRDELCLMDSGKRTEALEDAGLDPCDHDDFDW